MRNTPLAERETYSMLEVARLLGIGTNQVYRAAERGEIPTIRIGQRFFVPKIALERFLEAAATTPFAVTAPPQRKAG